MRMLKIYYFLSVSSITFSPNSNLNFSNSYYLIFTCVRIVDDDTQI